MRPKYLSHAGLTLSVTAWAARVGLPRGTLGGRLKLGWPVHLALSVPNNGKGVRRARIGRRRVPYDPADVWLSYMKTRSMLATATALRVGTRTVRAIVTSHPDYVALSPSDRIKSSKARHPPTAPRVKPGFQNLREALRAFLAERSA